MLFNKQLLGGSLHNSRCQKATAGIIRRCAEGQYLTNRPEHNCDLDRFLTKKPDSCCVIVDNPDLAATSFVPLERARTHGSQCHVSTAIPVCLTQLRQYKVQSRLSGKWVNLRLTCDQTADPPSRDVI